MKTQMNKQTQAKAMTPRLRHFAIIQVCRMFIVYDSCTPVKISFFQVRQTEMFSAQELKQTCEMLKLKQWKPTCFISIYFNCCELLKITSDGLVYELLKICAILKLVALLLSSAMMNDRISANCKDIWINRLFCLFDWYRSIFIQHFQLHFT